MTDKEITLSSGLLPLLNSGDMVMADKGFEVETELAEINVVLNKPPKLGQHKQMAASDVGKTWIIAELHIHIERCIGRA